MAGLDDLNAFEGPKGLLYRAWLRRAFREHTDGDEARVQTLIGLMYGHLSRQHPLGKFDMKKMHRLIPEGFRGLTYFTGRLTGQRKANASRTKPCSFEHLSIQ